MTPEVGTTAVLEAPAPKPKKAAAPKAKPAAVKKKTTPAGKTAKPKAKAKKTAEVDRSMAEVPVGDRRIALVKAMRKAHATSAQDALTVEALAEKVGYTKFDVYGLLSGTSGKAGSNPRCLLATGHAKVADTQDGRGYYLTAKGTKTSFKEIPFVSKSAAAE